MLSDAPFVCDSGLVWLDAGRHALAPLASLAECGKTGCACTRLLFPEVRTGFRREVVRRAVEGRASGRLPADGRIVYASIGAGLPLSDFDLICGLQQAGFTLTSVALIDPEYAPQPTSDRLQASERHLAALKDLTDYLGDDASVRTWRRWQRMALRGCRQSSPPHISSCRLIVTRCLQRTPSPSPP